MDKKEFIKHCESLQQFINKHDKLNEVAKLLVSDCSNNADFGYEFIDSYIELMQIAINDSDKYINWFFLERNCKEGKVIFEKKEYLIKNFDDLYEIILKFQ